MPVARYFLYVGGALLALLYVIGTLLPHEAMVASNDASAVERPVVRIHSTQKLPERVVYDTSLPTIVPPTANVQVAAAPAPPASAQERARDTDAQFAPAAKQSESRQGAPESRPRVAAEQRSLEPPAPKKHKMAKFHSNPPYGYGPPMRFGLQPQSPMRVAQQQPRFGFFGMSTWNSTW
jgi:hypothetical protein